MEFNFYHAVPLGSIPELPAESCSEIKASEGIEMVNGDYWIYSDGNSQAVPARCEGVAFWLIMSILEPITALISSWYLNCVLLNFCAPVGSFDTDCP